MEEVFASRARSTFKDLYALLISQCEAHGGLACVEVAPTMDGALAEWHSYCHSEIGHQDVKYARTVERITGQPCRMYHALQYHDAGILETRPLCIAGATLPLHALVMSPQLSEKQRASAWRLITELSTASYEADHASHANADSEHSENNHAPPHVPSRNELQTNLRKKKSAGASTRANTHTITGTAAAPEAGPVTEQASMVRAFQASMHSLCDVLGSESKLAHASDEGIREWMQRWTKFSTTEVDGVRCDTLCNDESAAAAEALAAQFPELGATLPLPAGAWAPIKQLNGFSTVGSTIPPKMMGRIEDMANRLAADIVSGKQDMSSMDLQEIGKQVLSGCDESDMSTFAGSIDQLLPALQNLQPRPT
jgi:hypothetical protein